MSHQLQGKGEIVQARRGVRATYHRGPCPSQLTCAPHSQRPSRLLPCSASVETDRQASAQRSRRELLHASGAALLLPAGASWAESSDHDAAHLFNPEQVEFALRIVSLRGSVPQEWPLHWRQIVEGRSRLRLENRAQLADIYDDLDLKGRTGKAASKAAATADLVSMGDAWLGPAIQAGLLQPIPQALSSSWWKGLGRDWKKLLRRNELGEPAAKGHVYAAPYRWGCTLIAVRNDRLIRQGGTAIQDWSDLLQPSLKGRLAFSASARDFVGVALKSLGAPMNATAQQLKKRGITSDKLQGRLDQLRDQVRSFDSSEQGNALMSGDVTAAVGCSTELIAFARRSTNISLVAPASGVALWADLWAVPAKSHGTPHGRGPSPLLPVWLDFCLQPQRTQEHQGLQQGASPRLLSQLLGDVTSQAVDVPSSLQDDSAENGRGRSWSNLMQKGAGAGMQGLSMPSAEVLRSSEFLLPQDDATKDLCFRALHPHWDQTVL